MYFCRVLFKIGALFGTRKGGPQTAHLSPVGGLRRGDIGRKELLRALQAPKHGKYVTLSPHSGTGLLALIPGKPPARPHLFLERRGGGCWSLGRASLSGPATAALLPLATPGAHSRAETRPGQASGFLFSRGSAPGSITCVTAQLPPRFPLSGLPRDESPGTCCPPSPSHLCRTGTCAVASPGQVHWPFPPRVLTLPATRCWSPDSVSPHLPSECVRNAYGVPELGALVLFLHLSER